jgi:hypothetical protein
MAISFFDIMMREVWSSAQSDTAGKENSMIRIKASINGTIVPTRDLLLRRCCNSKIIQRYAGKRQIKMEERCWKISVIK